MLGILVVIQSTTGRPPLQLKLSGHRSLIQHALRQSRRIFHFEARKVTLPVTVSTVPTIPMVSYNPARDTLSEPALALFRLHVERTGNIDVDGTNREAYRELAGAEVMSRFVGRGEEPAAEIRG